MLVIISLSFPQSDPVKAFRILFLDCTLDFKSSVCCLNDRRLSKVMPRNLGFLTVGTCSPFISIGRVMLHSLDAVVNRVAEDLAGEINRFLLLNQESVDYSVETFGH